ncbi:hypothetical protein [uncultured Microbulbifer sp.]|uniref:hypothetical protein n=1 Tax=uncultured Microbulbifer sp. TaxID=348147 RepID=UPI00261C1A9E|nr:hypothetical protein [uncultured Microbulbifer sp.]
MKIEEISKVEIIENGELYVILKSGGQPTYQYIYREAAEVYWDESQKGFKSPPPRKWRHSEWYQHIVSVAASGLGISLRLTKNTVWSNVPERTKTDIHATTNT